MYETVWYTRKIICRNGIVERTKYPVRLEPGQRPKREAARTGRSLDAAEKQLARIINNNFEARKDNHLGFEYSEAGYKKLEERADKLREKYPGMEERDLLFLAAQIEASNWARRVQREIGGAEKFRCVIVTSDMDGETGEPARIHHHIVIAGDLREVAVRKWKKMGFVKELELYTVNMDFTALATYLMRQVRYIPNVKRYTPSRCLVQPVVEEPVRVTRFAESEMRPPAGCVVLARSPYVRGAAQYMRYYRPPERQKVSRATVSGKKRGGEKCG